LSSSVVVLMVAVKCFLAGVRFREPNAEELETVT
jgi:hypothetical protein